MQHIANDSFDSVNLCFRYYSPLKQAVRLQAATDPLMLKSTKQQWRQFQRTIEIALIARQTLIEPGTNVVCFETRSLLAYGQLA